MRPPCACTGGSRVDAQGGGASWIDVLLQTGGATRRVDALDGDGKLSRAGAALGAAHSELPSQRTWWRTMGMSSTSRRVVETVNSPSCIVDLGLD